MQKLNGYISPATGLDWPRVF